MVAAYGLGFRVSDLGFRPLGCLFGFKRKIFRNKHVSEGLEGQPSVFCFAIGFSAHGLTVGSGWEVEGFRVSGFQGFRVSGFQGFRVSGLQGFRASGFQGFRVSGFQGFRVSGFQGFRV